MNLSSELIRSTGRRSRRRLGGEAEEPLSELMRRNESGGILERSRGLDGARPIRGGFRLFSLGELKEVRPNNLIASGSWRRQIVKLDEPIDRRSEDDRLREIRLTLGDEAEPIRLILRRRELAAFRSEEDPFRDPRGRSDQIDNDVERLFRFRRVAADRLELVDASSL